MLGIRLAALLIIRTKGVAPYKHDHIPLEKEESLVRGAKKVMPVSGVFSLTFANIHSLH